MAACPPTHKVDVILKINITKPAVLALVVANLVPLVGVFWLGWDAFALLLLFWLENVVIGFYNVLRMAVARGNRSGATSRFILIPFFIIHFGAFTLGHGLMLFAIFSDLAGVGRPEPGELFGLVLGQVRDRHLEWPLLALFVSHGVSFATNTLAAGEFRQLRAEKLMGQPYHRIIMMHLTVLFGALLAHLSGNSAWALVVLVGLKLAVDWRSHLAERQRMTSGYS